MEHKDNLLGVLKTIFKWKKQILYVCLAAGVGSIVISLFLSNYYESTTSFYVASPDQALPEMVGLEASNRNYYGTPEDIDRILTIAESQEIADYLIAKYKLYEHYDIDSTQRLAPFKIKKRFYKLYNVKKTKFDAIEISIEDKDPKLAAAMVNDARYKVSQLAQNMIKRTQLQKLTTYKKAIEDKNKELNVLGDSLLRVRNRFGVYNTDTQSEALSGSIAKVKSRLSRENARKDLLASKPQIPRDTILLIQAGINGMEQELITLEGTLNLFSQGFSKVEVLEEIHEESRGQLSLDKERVKQLEAVYNSDFNTVYLVEAGEEPIYKSRPKRSIICVASVFIAFALVIVLVLLLETYKDVNWREIYNG